MTFDDSQRPTLRGLALSESWRTLTSVGTSRQNSGAFDGQARLVEELAWLGRVSSGSSLSPEPLEEPRSHGGIGIVAAHRDGLASDAELDQWLREMDLEATLATVLTIREIIGSMLARELGLDDPESIEPAVIVKGYGHLASITLKPDGLEPPIRTLVSDLIAAPSAPGAAA